MKRENPILRKLVEREFCIELTFPDIVLLVLYLSYTKLTVTELYFATKFLCKLLGLCEEANIQFLTKFLKCVKMLIEDETIHVQDEFLIITRRGTERARKILSYKYVCLRPNLAIRIDFLKSEIGRSVYVVRRGDVMRMIAEELKISREDLQDVVHLLSLFYKGLARMLS